MLLIPEGKDLLSRENIISTAGILGDHVVKEAMKM